MYNISHKKSTVLSKFDISETEFNKVREIKCVLRFSDDTCLQYIAIIKRAQGCLALATNCRMQPLRRLIVIYATIGLCSATLCRSAVFTG